MTLLKTDEATKATAAIYNAAKNIAKTSSANLRLSNLERSVRNMNRNPTNSLRESLIPRNPKNPQGRHTKEPMASPQQQASHRNNKRKLKVVDLTLDDGSEDSMGQNMTQQNVSRKTINKKKIKSFSPPKKTVQWSCTETMSFNPNHPVSSTLTTPFAHSPLLLYGATWNPLPSFMLAPPPPPPTHFSHTGSFQYPTQQRPPNDNQHQGQIHNPFFFQNQARSNTSVKNNPFLN